MNEQEARRPSVIAHRGASVRAPENTLEAFRLAGSIGADAVELDVRRSADGALVVCHDAHLPDGTALVHLARADLPDSIPDLARALEACAGMWVNVEIKNDPTEPDFDPDRLLAGAVVELLRATGPDDRWVVSSFDYDTIDAVARLAPGLPTAWLVIQIEDQMPELLRSAGHAAVHPWVETLTEEQVRRSHAAGISVNTWTCNDPVRLAELARWGVDGVCTDVPDLALEVLGRH